MSYLNYIDLLVLIIFIGFTSIGFMRGFINEIISLFFMIIAFIIASLYAEPLANTFTTHSALQDAVSQATSVIGIDTATHASKTAIAFSFSAIFLGIMLIGIIIAYILRIALKSPQLNVGTRIIGSIFGLGKGIIISFAVVFVLHLTTISEKDYWEDSEVIETLQPAINYLSKIVSPALANEKTAKIDGSDSAIETAEQPSNTKKLT